MIVNQICQMKKEEYMNQAELLKNLIIQIIKKKMIQYLLEFGQRKGMLPGLQCQEVLGIWMLKN